MDFIIREATVSDAAEIMNIYGYYVENTFVTFSEVNPSEDEYKSSIIEIQKEYPYIVACDSEGRVIGMAYASRVRHHDAYRYSVESTIYLAHDIPKKTGIGRALYTELEKRLKAMGYIFMYGVITDDNMASIEFHKALGFDEVGHFTNIGYKFGKWKGIVWYCKQIGSLDVVPQNK